MAWDSSRPVPWKRLVREWLIYVGIMAVLFLIFFRDDPLVGIFAGLLVSGPLYLLVGYVLAKFGYQRKTLRQARAEIDSTRASARSGGASSAGSPGRPKPAPTRRTGAGSNRPGGRRAPAKRRR
jgi:hypothetical protein